MKELEDFVSLAEREFRRSKALADDSISQLSREQFFVSLKSGDNSVALVCKHMAGNMLSRWTDFLTSDGEKANRKRDEEFLILEGDTFEALMERWEAAWAVLFEALAELDADSLGKVVTIRGEGLTVLQAICRQLAHYAYHAGQIVFLAKHLVGEDWESLSIPVGQSEAFNKAPSKYVKE